MKKALLVQNGLNNGISKCAWYIFQYDMDLYHQLYINEQYLLNPQNNQYPKSDREAIGILKKEYPNMHKIATSEEDRMNYRRGSIYFLKWL